MVKLTRTISKTFPLLVLSCAVFSHTAAASQWTFELEPYALGANIEGDASVGRATGAAVEVDLDQILENLE